MWETARGRTIREAIDDFTNFNKAQGRSDKTIGWYGWILGEFCRWAKGILGIEVLSQIEATHIWGYMVRLRERAPINHHNSTRLSEATIRGHAITIKRFFSWAYSEGIIPDNPTARLVVPRVSQAAIVGLSAKEIGALLRGTEGRRTESRDKAIILLLLDTGIRVGELAGLSIPDVDFEADRAKVLGKGRRERFVPLGQVVQTAIREYMMRNRLPRNGHLFLARGGGPMTEDSVLRVVKGCAKNGGIERRCYPHLLRHTFAINFLRYGGGEFALQRILGHSTLEMTRRYTNLLFDDIAQAHRMASPVDNLDAFRSPGP